MPTTELSDLYEDLFNPACCCGLTVWDHPFESDHDFAPLSRTQPELIGLS